MGKKKIAFPTPEELNDYRSKIKTYSYLGVRQLAQIFMALDAATQKQKDAEKVLRFYANEFNYSCGPTRDGALDTCTSIEDDGGLRARELLDAWRKARTSEEA